MGKLRRTCSCWRLLMAVGAGFQIAASHYHQYNHAPVFTIRFPF
jgi:hypothetical protein